MGELNTGGQGRLWGTWVPTSPDLSAGVSLVTRDLQGMLLVYDQTGKLVSTVREGMSTDVNGVNLAVVQLIGSTGLQIKADPGIPMVYTGFGLLMLGVVMSYVSHSQVWALQIVNRLYIGGRTNRAQVAFERELIALFDQLSEAEHEAAPQSHSQPTLVS
jgi:cytochrome c biogenesis protein